LLQAATASGDIQAGIGAEDFLDAIAYLCQSHRDTQPAYSQRMVGLLVDEMRYRMTWR